MGAALLSFGAAAVPSVAAPPIAVEETEVARMMRLGDVESGTLYFDQKTTGNIHRP